MSKNRKVSPIDFDFGADGIVPSTQEAYHGEFQGEIRRSEKEGLSIFKATLGAELDRKLVGNGQFPTDGEVFVFIVQYFISGREYARRDIDNIAKTILDVLKGRFYQDDSQVKTLLIGKKMERRVPQNFAYTAIQELSPGRDADALKISGIERSVTLFQELKSKGVL